METQPARRRRERKVHFGELVQLDGSFHPWFEARGPASCLLTLVDDATGRSLGQFSTQETLWAAVAGFQSVDQRPVLGVHRGLATAAVVGTIAAGPVVTPAAYAPARQYKWNLAKSSDSLR